jgi:hypothetical protein
VDDDSISTIDVTSLIDPDEDQVNDSIDNEADEYSSRSRESSENETDSAVQQ